MEADTGRLKYLDGLRALAVLAVVAGHSVVGAKWAHQAFDHPEAARGAFWFATLAAKGAHGVDLFFVLSGFCLAYPTLARLRRDGAASFGLSDFFSKRLVRIVPPFYAAILLTYAGFLFARHLGIPIPSSMSAATSAIDIVRTMLFLDQGTHLIDVAFWTLFVELRWYVFFPVALALYIRSPRMFFAAMAACVAAYNFTTLRAVDIAVLPAFMAGIVAADWHITGNRFAKYSLLLAFLSFDLALMLEPFASVPSRFGGPDDVRTVVQTNPGWQLVAFFFVVAVGRAGWLRRLFGFAPLCAVGVAAYSIYLVHLPLVNLWTECLALDASPVTGFCGAWLLAVGGGYVFFVLAERPFILDPFRRRCIDAIRPAIVRVLEALGLPLRIALTAQRLPVVADGVERSAPAMLTAPRGSATRPELPSP